MKNYAREYADNCAEAFSKDALKQIANECDLIAGTMAKRATALARENNKKEAIEYQKELDDFRMLSIYLNRMIDRIDRINPK